jgi:homoserine kinase type II
MTDPQTMTTPRPPVPRPAVAREHSEPLAVDALADAWDVGPWTSIAMLPVGKSDHYRLETPAGSFVLRRSYPGKPLADVAFEHDLVGYLRGRGFPAPDVLPARDGTTEVVAGDRVHRLSRWVEGTEHTPGDARQLAAAGRALGRYHALVREHRPATPPPAPVPLREKLAAAVVAVRDSASRPPRAGDGGAPAQRLREAVPPLVARAEQVLDLLDRLDPGLCVLTIHGGCRRGSAIFRGPELATMLDFDSARRELVALDIAIALHDWAKVYTARGMEDHKVLLDLDVVARFMAAYRTQTELGPEELQAIPALLAARPLSRALRKCRKRLDGEAELTEGDLGKVVRESGRVLWLEAHAAELAAALAGHGPDARTTMTTTTRKQP